MNQILLQISIDSSAIVTMVKSDFFLYSIWFWISLIEFFFVIFLVVKIRGIKQNLTFSDLPKDIVENAKSKEIDMNSLMNSIYGSKELFKELSKACHPDKFVNTDKQIIAEEIFQEISKDRRNFAKLLLHKERIIKELEINF